MQNIGPLLNTVVRAVCVQLKVRCEEARCGEVLKQRLEPPWTVQGVQQKVLRLSRQRALLRGGWYVGVGYRDVNLAGIWSLI